jgi:hypothetical protein
MRHMKHGLVWAVALAAACGLAETASATTIDPPNTAFSMTSTTFSLNTSGGIGPTTCTHATLTGTTPAAGAATWKSIPVTPRWVGCTEGGFPLTVNPSHACHTLGTSPILHLHSSGLGFVTWNGCTIHVVNHATGCTKRWFGFLGSTTGVGITWTNRSPKSALDFNTATASTIVSNGIGIGCPSAGAHTGTVSATYTIDSATNVTVTP